MLTLAEFLLMLVNSGKIEKMSAATLCKDRRLGRYLASHYYGWWV